MRIKDMFQAKIDREITGVIKVGQHDEAVKEEELKEYVVTRELAKHFDEFFGNYSKSISTPTDNMGVWISGFFGSGKSHFLKILSYVLDNAQVGGKSVIDYFADKERIADNAMLMANMKLASDTSTQAILFNVDSKSAATGKSDSNAIVLVFNRVFNEKLGYTGAIPALADLERTLDEEGRYQEFQDVFEKIVGKPWMEERHKFKVRRGKVEQTLVEMKYMTAEEAAVWAKESSEGYSIAIEDFAQRVADYIERTGERVVFLVDEIGQFISKESKLMLNLQTMTEELGNKCHGKAWVIVTSQEDIDSMTENLRSDGTSGNDFSKIQGRFKTRLSLSSVNADEVIRERILKKNEYGDQALRALYQSKEMTMKNVIDFDTPILLKKFENEKEFSEVYPFVPYQFDLLADVLNAIRTNSSTGKHLSEGERSMLGAFQAAAKNVMNEEDGVLIPFYRFYDDLVKFLDHTHAGVIQKAQDNARINPNLEDDCFNVNVLKTLFLLKYVNGVPLTVKNIVSLMICNIDEDRATLKKKVNDALDILESNLLISEMQGTYEFLTDEEQDINRQIQDRNIQMADVISAVADMVFDQIYTQTRYKMSKFNGRYTFAFNRAVDNKPKGNVKTEDIGIRFLTPWYLGSGGKGADDVSAMMMSTANNEVIFLLPANNELYLKELQTALKIDDYIRHVGDPEKGKSTLIREVKIHESARHKDSASSMLKDAIADAKVFISGSEVTDITSNDATVKIGVALERQVELHYPKLSYIDKAMEDGDVRKLFDKNSQTSMSLGSSTEPNSNAVKDVTDYIKLNTAGHMSISLKTIMDQFTKAPYGFIDVDVKWLVAKIYKDGMVTATVEKEPVTLFNRKADELANYFLNRKYVEKLLLIPKEEIEPKKMKAAKDVCKELFKVTEATADAERLQASIQGKSEVLKGKCERAKDKADAVSEYPGRDTLENALNYTALLISLTQTKSFYDKIYDIKDELLDLAEDLDPVLNFYMEGAQKKNFDDYGLRALKFYNSSKEHIVDPELEDTIKKIKQIIDMKQPYAKLKDLPQLYDDFVASYGRILKEKAIPVKDIIDQDKDALLERIAGKSYEEKYKMEITNRFNDLKKRVDHENDISDMLGFKDKADSLRTQYSNRIDNETEYTQDPDTGDKISDVHGDINADASKPKKVMNKMAREITSDWRIENRDDLERCIDKLQKQIEAYIDEDTIINIQF